MTYPVKKILKISQTYKFITTTSKKEKYCIWAENNNKTSISYGNHRYKSLLGLGLFGQRSKLAYMQMQWQDRVGKPVSSNVWRRLQECMSSLTLTQTFPPIGGFNQSSKISIISLMSMSS